MPTDYSQISDYWSKNPCSGGNAGFPFYFFKNKKVLEIGTGMGIDAMRFIVWGADYKGIDLTTPPKHLESYIRKMNAETIDFPDNYFDLVYSFGVIHHTLNPEKVLDEAYRVLKDEGKLFLMLYNKFSFRYLLEIKILRRILWFFHYHKFREIRKILPHPDKQQWLSINTDTIGCPMSRAYTKKDVERLLGKFEITETWTENWGWFRMICAKKKSIM